MEGYEEMPNGRHAAFERGYWWMSNLVRLSSKAIVGQPYTEKSPTVAVLEWRTVRSSTLYIVGGVGGRALLSMLAYADLLPPTNTKIHCTAASLDQHYAEERRVIEDGCGRRDRNAHRRVHAPQCMVDCGCVDQC